jgi:hypothetical protein
MRRTINTALCLLALALAAAASAQEPRVYTNEGIEYALELPSPAWRVVPRSDDARDIEFIHQDRSDALLRVRKELVEPDVKPEELAGRDRDTKLRMRHQNGFVEGKIETFSGRLPGVAAPYEFTQGGKPMVGRVYYLRADPRTVYVLHFTGRRETLLQLRAQTDAIARSFRLK